MFVEPIRERVRGLEPRELIAVALVGALVVAGAAFWYVRSLPRPVTIDALSPRPAGVSTPGSSAPAASPSASPAILLVHVAGAVRHPGVYDFEQGDRIVDAIRRAGGARPGADLRSINLAAQLIDGEQIVVMRGGAPPGDSVAAGAVPAGSSTSTSGVAAGSGTGVPGETELVNVNTATPDELESLPGIGEVLAQRIIDYREQHGPFASVEELLEVSGIGDQTLADIEPHITV